MFCMLSKIYMISSLNKSPHTHTMHHDHSMVYLATLTLHTSLKTVQNVLFWLCHSTCTILQQYIPWQLKIFVKKEYIVLHNTNYDKTQFTLPQVCCTPCAWTHVNLNDCSCWCVNFYVICFSCLLSLGVLVFYLGGKVESEESHVCDLVFHHCNSHPQHIKK